MISKLEPKEWLGFNAQLAKKKNALRKELKEIGILKKDKTNDYDHYSYFSEAGYKKLFTELFAAHGLELTANEIEYELFDSPSSKMPNGRKVTFEFILTDTDTGFYEISRVTGEGMDKGDKAGYKADTGALKYYLANTFMVATGDDAENESPESNGNKNGNTNGYQKGNKPANNPDKATSSQIKTLAANYKGENLSKLLAANNITTLEDMPRAKANELISALYAKAAEKKAAEKKQ